MEKMLNKNHHTKEEPQKALSPKQSNIFDEANLGVFNCDNIDCSNDVKKILEGLNCAAAIIEDNLAFEYNNNLHLANT